MGIAVRIPELALTKLVFAKIGPLPYHEMRRFWISPE
jgi:hypothetical protein